MNCIFSANELLLDETPTPFFCRVGFHVMYRGTISNNFQASYTGNIVSGVCVIARISSHNANMSTGVSYIKCDNVASSIHSIGRLLCLDVRKKMLSSISQPLVRPLHNGSRIAL